MSDDARTLGPPSRELNLAIGGHVSRVRVYHMGDHVVIPYEARTAQGGYVRGVLETDVDTYETAMAWAAARGLNAVSFADLAMRVTGQRPLLSITARPMLPRG